AKHHIAVECQPTIATADALADALIETGSPDIAKNIVVTGNRNRGTLVAKLEQASAIVDQLPLYRPEATDLSHHPAAERFREGGADAVLFASSSAVEAFAQQAGALAPAKGARRPVAGSI